jgi:hypothetical protein
MMIPPTIMSRNNTPNTTIMIFKMTRPAPELDSVVVSSLGGGVLATSPPQRMIGAGGNGGLGLVPTKVGAVGLLRGTRSGSFGTGAGGGVAVGGVMGGLSGGVKGMVEKPNPPAPVPPLMNRTPQYGHEVRFGFWPRPSSRLHPEHE